LFGSWATLLSLVVPFMGLLLHRDHLCGLLVAGLWVLPQLPVKDGQLLIELAPGFRKLVESCPSLGVGGAATRHWLRFGAA
jgi:hypothetical protein